MPELPEVESVVRGLAPLVAAKVKDVQLSGKRLREDIPKDLGKEIQGRKITSITRRAKYIIIEFSGGVTMLAHLGMSGFFTIVEKKDVKKHLRPLHTHMVINFFDGRVLEYTDPRRFGLITMGQSVKNHLSPLGVEPLSDEFSGKMLFDLSRKVRTPMKTFLLDQSKISGLGNIYVAEALFLAGVSPLREAANLTKKEADKLALAIKKVLIKSIENEGTTLKDFRKANGSEGHNQQSLLVYGRAGEKCEKCGTPILKIVQAGRSTFYCKKCQK